MSFQTLMSRTKSQRRSKGNAPDMNAIDLEPVVKVLGIDPGTRVTGFGIVTESKGSLIAEGWGGVKTDFKAPMPTRLKQIADGLRDVIEKYRPSEVSLEECFFAKDAKSALKLGQARGVIMLVAEEAGLKVTEYAPLKIKQSVTGYGQADKAQVGLMVRNLLELTENVTPVDAADALAIAITHINHKKFENLERA